MYMAMVQRWYKDTFPLLGGAGSNDNEVVIHTSARSRSATLSLYAI